MSVEVKTRKNRKSDFSFHDSDLEKRVLASRWLVLYFVWQKWVISLFDLEKELAKFKFLNFGGQDNGRDFISRRMEDILLDFEELGYIWQINGLIFWERSSGYKMLVELWPIAKEIIGDKVSFKPIAD